MLSPFSLGNNSNRQRQKELLDWYEDVFCLPYPEECVIPNAVMGDIIIFPVPSVQVVNIQTGHVLDGLDDFYKEKPTAYTFHVHFSLTTDEEMRRIESLFLMKADYSQFVNLVMNGILSLAEITNEKIMAHLNEIEELTVEELESDEVYRHMIRIRDECFYEIVESIATHEDVIRAHLKEAYAVLFDLAYVKTIWIHQQRERMLRNSEAVRMLDNQIGIKKLWGDGSDACYLYEDSPFGDRYYMPAVKIKGGE